MTTTTIKSIVALAKKNNRKFEPEDVTPALRQFAQEFIRSYEGSFEFLVKLQVQERIGRRALSDGQVKGILNCVVAEANRAEALKKQPKSIQQVVSNGTYTVLFDKQGKDYVTMRLVEKDWVKDKPKGTQVAQYLYGPDNSRSFKGFAFVTGDDIQVWSAHRHSDRLVKALTMLITSGKAPVFGEEYAKRSGKCYRCGRKLTVPASLHRGMGPDCAGVR